MPPQSPTDSVWLRLLRPGLPWGYPDRPFKHRDALYCAYEDAAFLVTKIYATSQDASVDTELAIWFPEEVRVLGAITLSVPEGNWVAFSPWHHTALPDVSVSQDLSADCVVQACRDHAKKLIVECEKEAVHSHTLRAIRSDPETAQYLFENIDVGDSLLLRGLYTLMKSALLIQSSWDFREEAFMNLQISCEAALQMIKEHVGYLGNPSPGYRDAYEHIRGKFRMGEALSDYLEMQYGLWKDTKHPDNSYYVGWAPPLYAEDVYETYECKVRMYKYVVTGEAEI